jgi:hypothetical protein
LVTGPAMSAGDRAIYGIDQAVGGPPPDDIRRARTSEATAQGPASLLVRRREDQA